MSQKVLSYDLGGTKVAVGIINSRGRILEEVRTPIVLAEGKNAVLKQIAELGQVFLRKYPEVKRVGVASAGPLDPRKGLLLDPTNFVSEKGTWGQVPLCAILKKRLKRPVYLDNDAAAAVLAEHWIGAGKNVKNLMVLTLGTGLGTGIICNGKLLRSGRNLHPEAGHLIIGANDHSAPCGCGNLGCAEAYLSGRNFTRRARRLFSNAPLTALEISTLARAHDPRALSVFEDYSQLMAIALHNYVRIYCPEMVVFAGSFAQSADLFLDRTHELLKHLLIRQRKGNDLLPKLTVSTLQNESSLIGGAYIALHPEY